jgi:Cu+-exporting ATPase
MFNFFNTKSNPDNLTRLSLKTSGMHCSSCAVNIDLTLEDLPGVKTANTNYAKSITIIKFDSQEIDQQHLVQTIKKLGYQVNVAD